MKFKVGDCVRLSGKFLRNTGQVTGGEGEKVWTAVLCICPLCARDFVAVDELDIYGESLRHINTANLVKFGSLDGSVDSVAPIETMEGLLAPKKRTKVHKPKKGL